MVANQAREGPCPSQLSTESHSLLRRLSSHRSHWKRRRQEVQAENVDAQPLHRTTMGNALGVFDDPSARNLPPRYSVSPEFMKDVVHDWILKCVLPAGPREKALEQLYRTNSRLVQVACIDHFIWLLS